MKLFIGTVSKIFIVTQKELNFGCGGLRPETKWLPYRGFCRPFVFLLY